MKIQHSGGTGTSSCLVHNVMNYQIDKKQKQTNKPAYQLPTTVLFLLQSLLLVKFSFFGVVSFFFGGLIGCGEDDQLALLYSVFIYSSFTSFWVIPYKSWCFFGLFIVLSIIASVFNHHPCPRIHSSLVISWCTFHNPQGFAWRKAAGFQYNTIQYKFYCQLPMGAFQKQILIVHSLNFILLLRVVITPSVMSESTDR